MPQSTSARTALAKLFDAVERPIVAFDVDSRLVYINPWLCQRLGTTQQELLGKIVLYRCGQDGSPLQNALERLAPPPETLAGTSSAHLPVLIPETSGDDPQESRTWDLDYHPLLGKNAEVVGAIGIGSEWPRRTPFQFYHSSGSDAVHQALIRLRLEWQRSLQLDTALVGESPDAVLVRRQVSLARHCKENVLVVGPSGCGKERIARSIHYAGSDPQNTSLIPLDCTVLDHELLQTTVTAFLRRCAELETATVPTLLLLDVDRLDETAQNELLGILSIHELEIRAISTSQSILNASSLPRSFRYELATILSTMVVQIRPLHSRPQDIAWMAQDFLEQCNLHSGTIRQGFTSDAMEYLAVHAWRGELDELQQVVIAAHRKAEGAWIQRQDLPKSLSAQILGHAPAATRDLHVARAMAELETSLLVKAMRIAKGNKSKAARLLGMSRPKLLRRLEHFKLLRSDESHDGS